MLWTVWKIYTYSIDQWPKQSRVHQKPAFRRLFRALSTCRFCPKTFSTFCSFSQVRPQNTRLQGFYDFNRSIWSRSLLLLWQLAIKQQTWQCKITFWPCVFYYLFPSFRWSLWLSTFVIIKVFWTFIKLIKWSIPDLLLVKPLFRN